MLDRPSLSKNFPFSFFRKSPKIRAEKLNSKKSKRKKALIYAIIAILVLAAVAFSSFKPLEGAVMTVQPKEFVKGFTEEGQVSAAKEWPLYTALNAEIIAIPAQNGEQVKKGQVLLQLDTQNLTYQLEALKAQRKSVEGQRLQAHSDPYQALLKQQNLLIAQAEKDNLAQEQNFTRQKALYEAGALSLAQYEEAQLQAEKAKNFLGQQKAALELIFEQHEPQQGTEQLYSGQIEALNAQIAQMEDQIAKGRLVAPEDGLIKDLNLKQGEWVMPGQLLMNLFQNSAYKVESYVLASEASAIKSGDSVEVIQDSSLGEQVLSGHVESIDPSAIERISPLGLKENRVKITILLPDESALIIGSTLDVRFTTHREADQLMVPKTALFPYADGEAVWVIRESKAQIQSVLKGMENEREVVILEGLASGDQVLLDTDLPGLKEGKTIKSE